MFAVTGRRARRHAVVIAVTAVVAALIAPAAAAQPDAPGLHLKVLSSRPDQVTGGNALVEVQVARGVPLADVTVRRNGADVTGEFRADSGNLVGLVDGLHLGGNTLDASAGHGATARLTLTDFPDQRADLLRAAAAAVRVHDRAVRPRPAAGRQPGRHGLQVFALDANGTKTSQIVGWSRDCAPPPGRLPVPQTAEQCKPLPADGGRPADLATTTTLDGRSATIVVRCERGTSTASSTPRDAGADRRGP